MAPIFSITQEDVNRILKVYANGRELRPKDIQSFTEQLKGRLQETMQDWAEEFFQEAI